MPDAKRDTAAVYDALRCDLIPLLMEYRSQGCFTRAAEGTVQERSLFLGELTQSIADILVTAYPKTAPQRIRWPPSPRSARWPVLSSMTGLSTSH